jgi:hypothetical protein
MQNLLQLLVGSQRVIIAGFKNLVDDHVRSLTERLACIFTELCDKVSQSRPRKLPVVEFVLAIDEGQLYEFVDLVGLQPVDENLQRFEEWPVRRLDQFE